MPIDRRDGSESEESGEVLEDVDPVTVDAPLEGNATPLAEQDQQEEAKPITSRWDDHSDEEAVAKDVPGNLPKSRWLDDEAEDATDKPPDGDGGVVGAHQADHASLKPDENLVVPTEDPEGLATDGAPLAQESAAPVHPRKRNMLLESRGKDNFEFLREIGSGTYGLVSKARDKTDNEIVALKKIKLNPQHFRVEGFPMTSVREINILLTMDHPNIVNVSEVVTGFKKDGSQDVYMVMEFVQQDLKSFLGKYQARLKIGEVCPVNITRAWHRQVKRIVQQLLQGVKYMHENWVVHRDLKPANVLYDHFGNIKICDFGMARHFGDPVPHMSPVVVTRNYRGPEICMGVTNYTPALDIWSVGVIMAELLTNKVPFIDSKTDLDLVNTISKIIGSPHGRWKGLERLPRYRDINILEDVPNRLRQVLGVQKEGALPVALDHAFTEAGYNLIEKMLRWNPEERITASDAFDHAWFREVPRPTEACFMPQTNDALRQKYTLA